MAKSPEIRVTSGKLRGRALRSPDTSGTHPMGAREKLALFNMVNVEGERVLDAYAGSGAVGVEALSRGASEVVFVENNRRTARVILENLQTVGTEGQVFTEKIGDFAMKGEFLGYFGVILADPPYTGINIEELNKLPALLAENGVLALSSPAENAEIELLGMRISSTHTYARARLTIYRRK